MSQYDLLIDANTTSGSQLAQKLNDFASALKSGHLGGTEPTYKTAGMVWIDNSTGDYVFKLYKSNTWITLYTVKDTGIDVVGVRKDIDAYAVTVDDTDETSPTTYKISLPNLVALQTGQIFRIKTHKTCTGATTVRINGIAPVSIKKLGNIATELGDLQSGGITEIVYDGTQFLITSTIRNIMQGSYSASVGYLAGDLVVFGLSLYQCTTATSAGEDPTTTPAKWTIIIRGLDNVLTTIGDIVYHDGTKPVRLAKGAAGQSLVMGADNKPAWSTPAYRPYMGAAKLPRPNESGYTGSFITPEGGIKLWGGSNSRKSNGLNNQMDTGQLISLGLTNENTPSPSKFKDHVMGGHSFYALNEDGDVYSWGANDCGQLGHGDTIHRAVAKRVDYFYTNNIKIAKIIVPRDFTRIDTTYMTAFFITTTGLLYACGVNNEKQCGDTTTTTRSTPVRVGASINFDGVIDLDVSSTIIGSCYCIRQVGSERQLWVWGANNTNGSYQLGIGNVPSQGTPVRSGSFINVQQVVGLAGIVSGSSTYGKPSALIRDGGNVYSVGGNHYGCLGLGNETNQTSWQQISGFTNVQSIGGGGGYYPTTWLIDATGNLKLAGYNSYGQICRNDTVSYFSFSSPTAGDLSFQGKIAKVLVIGSISYSGIVVFTTDKIVYAWGFNGDWNGGWGDSTAVKAASHQVLGQRLSTTEAHSIVDVSYVGGGDNGWALMVLYSSGLVRMCGWGGVNVLGRITTNSEGMLTDVIS